MRTNDREPRTPQELMDHLNDYAVVLTGNGGKEIIPHIVFAHGFMRLTRMLNEKFPVTVWVGESVLSDINGNSIEPNQVDRLLYDRFSRELLAKPAFSSLTAQEKIDLVEKGWSEFRED